MNPEAQLARKLTMQSSSSSSSGENPQLIAKKKRPRRNVVLVENLEHSQKERVEEILNLVQQKKIRHDNHEEIKKVLDMKCQALATELRGQDIKLPDGQGRLNFTAAGNVQEKGFLKRQIKVDLVNRTLFEFIQATLIKDNPPKAQELRDAYMKYLENEEQKFKHYKYETTNGVKKLVRRNIKPKKIQPSTFVLVPPRKRKAHEAGFHSNKRMNRADNNSKMSL